MIESANELLCKALSTAQLISSYSSKSKSLVAKNLVALGVIENAKDVFNQAANLQMFRDDRKVDVFSFIAKTLVKLE